MDPRVGGGRDGGLTEHSFMADSKPQPPKETLPRRSMEPVSNPSRSQTRKLQLPHTLLKPSAPSSDASGDQESRLEANLGGDEFGNSRVKERVDSEARSESASGGRQSCNGRNSESGGGCPWKEKRGVGPRARVPFHIASIPRPQDQFGILVNNSNRPFQHVWLESEDGTGFVHPLEKLSVLDFVDKKFGEVEPTKPLPVEGAPFKLVEGVKELKDLASKLRDVHEFAVDLEHNQYRSFQGLTCLMQISTRTEDFVIDTLKLRVHVGPYLREAFKDPSKRKVMHGADRDILWLQRDFGIYVCNLFDTGQASRLMKLERNSLEYLLHHFCGINANKEYQNADWRLRPIPDEMLKYAREDTHYLLYIYDLMRSQLVSKPLDENGGDLLIEVYRRSYDTCIQLYQKELLTDASYLSIYGLQEADFNSQQFAIVAGLYEWRDHIARAEDESTGYILPNRALLEIAKQMPVSSSKLRHLVKSKHPFVERHLDSVIAIIRRSIQNTAAFENVSEQLKKRRQETAHGQNVETAEHDCESHAATDYPVESQAAQRNIYNGVNMARTMQNRESISASISARNDYAIPANTEHFSHQVPSPGKFWRREKFQPTSLSPYKVSKTVEKPNREATKTRNISSLRSAKTLSVVSVEMLDEPTCDLEASLGNKSSGFNSIVGFTMEQHQTEGGIEQMKSLGARPYYPFSCGDGHLEPSFEENIRQQCLETELQYFNQPTGATAVEIVPWENEADNSHSSMGRPALELFNQNQIQQRASYQFQIYPPVSKIFPDR